MREKISNLLDFALISTSCILSLNYLFSTLTIFLILTYTIFDCQIKIIKLMVKILFL